MMTCSARFPVSFSPPHSTPVARRPRSPWFWVHVVALSLLSLGITRTSQAQEEPVPMLLARSEQGGTHSLPLVAEQLTVRVDQGHATSEFAHTFQNETDEPLEGRYQVSLGTVARATGFAYENGDQMIVGEIFEKEAARTVYREVTGSGRDPGLLERAGEGTFSFRVAPIAPKEKKRIFLSTSSFLPQKNGVVEMQLPLGARGAQVQVSIVDTRPIGKVWSPTHELSVHPEGARVRVLVEGEKVVGKRFILRYQVREEPFQLSTAFHRAAGQDGYLMVSLAAPDVPQGPPKPRDVTLVIDRSGSMTGEPLSAAIAATRAVIEKLREKDFVNVIAFDDGIQSLFAAPEPIRNSRAAALHFVSSIRSGGGTDLALALREALDRQSSQGRPQFVLFLTDGQSDSKAALQAAAQASDDLRLYTVGIGSGVDRPLLARLARENRGRFTYVADEVNLERDVSQLYSRIETPVLADLKLQIRGARAHHVYPRRSPDLFPNDQLVWSLRLSPTEARPAEILLTGKSGNEPFEVGRTVNLSPIDRPWVGRLWAASRVDDLLERMALTGEIPELKQETLQLALAYDLVTRYTSFLAIPESEVTSGARQTLDAERARRVKILAKHPDAASLSRSLMPPGDPVLSVSAPPSAQGVTALFPFGHTLDLSYDSKRERWVGRFLVPHDVSDGTYRVRILVVTREGEIQETSTDYEIDSRPPAFDVQTTPQFDGVLVSVDGDEALREVRVTLLDEHLEVQNLKMEGQSCSRGGCLLKEKTETRFEGHLGLSPGEYRLRIVVTDRARNESVQIVSLVVEEDGC